METSTITLNEKQDSQSVFDTSLSKQLDNLELNEKQHLSSVASTEKSAMNQNTSQTAVQTTLNANGDTQKIQQESIQLDQAADKVQQNDQNSIQLGIIKPKLTTIELIDQFLQSPDLQNEGIHYETYKSEVQMPQIKNLMQLGLSEPYSIYTYRYFICNWPQLCYLAFDKEEIIGAIICKLDVTLENVYGYIAMLAVNDNYRRKKIGYNLVLRSIRQMQMFNAKEVILETEITNKAAIKLYENLGFIRTKRLFRYYLNGYDAFRLKLKLITEPYETC